MQPRITVITLGVTDLETSLSFYRDRLGYFQDPDRHLWEVVWNPQWSQ
jgi:catechol 2,3-dioxygenase-like lactoylglutathione lyase family enzyme